MSYLLNCVNCYLERWIGLQYDGGRPASFYFILIIFSSFLLAKMASNWGCALSSNAPYSRINTVIEKQKSSTNTRTRLANDAFLLKLPPPSRNCSDTFFDRSFTYGTSLMYVSDGCPTLTCLSLKLRRCYFYVISTVSMTLVI